MGRYQCRIRVRHRLQFAERLQRSGEFLDGGNQIVVAAHLETGDGALAEIEDQAAT